MSRWNKVVEEYYRMIDSSQAKDRWCEEAIPHLAKLLKDKLYDPITSDVLACSAPRGVKRGHLRQELTLSPKRLTQLLLAKRIEVTFERTIVALMDGKHGNWWNQFNPAAGVCAENTEAIDIARSVDNSARVLDLIEAKDWEARDEPFEGALQVLGYFCMFIACHSAGISPYPDWPASVSVRIWFLAPDAYFQLHGGLAEVNRTLGAVHRAFEQMKLSTPALAIAQFMPGALILDSSVRKRGFVDCFDTAKVQASIREELPVDNPKSLLFPCKIEMLRDWCTRAFTDGGMFVSTPCEMTDRTEADVADTEGKV